MRALLDGAVDVYETEKRYLHRDGHRGLGADRRVRRPRRGRTRRATSSRRRTTSPSAGSSRRSSRTGRCTTRSRVFPTARCSSTASPMRLRAPRRHAAKLAVLFVDLDRFKLVNDEMGHRAGDAVLVEAARRLSEAARVDDTVARFGGDEFTILCEGAGEEEARRVAERVLAALRRALRPRGREFQLSASVGVRVSDRCVRRVPTLLLRDADIALYAAKERGRRALRALRSASTRRRRRPARDRAGAAARAPATSSASTTSRRST